jgi:hypothetical protein
MRTLPKKAGMVITSTRRESDKAPVYTAVQTVRGGAKTSRS